MSSISRLTAAALLIASLAPAASQARSAGHAAAAPAAVLVAIPGAQSPQTHGRAAEAAAVLADYSLAPAQPQYANDADDGYLG